MHFVSDLQQCKVQHQWVWDTHNKHPPTKSNRTLHTTARTTAQHIHPTKTMAILLIIIQIILNHIHTSLTLTSHIIHLKSIHNQVILPGTIHNQAILPKTSHDQITHLETIQTQTQMLKDNRRREATRTKVKNLSNDRRKPVNSQGINNEKNRSLPIGLNQTHHLKSKKIKQAVDKESLYVIRTVLPTNSAI
ncbi:hypothetical protein ANCCAN_12684, partial [Ancylostoma caninum]